MRVLEHHPFVSRWTRPLVLRACIGVGLLLAPAAFAEDSPPAGEAASEVPSESPADDGKGDPKADPDSGSASIDDAVSIPLPPTTGVEEIVITGSMPDSLVKDETVSSIGFDAEVLKLEGIKDIRDLSNFTPSLEIKSAFAASNPTIFIRGVGLDDFNANAASAVAIYQDGVYMQSPAGQLFQFYDVEGVEVLRGPQPTLYRNASAGAILVQAKKPTEEFDAYLTSTYGNYNLIEVDGAFGGPIVPGVLSGRLSGSWGVRDGITENLCEGLARIPRRADTNGDGIRDPIIRRAKAPCKEFSGSGASQVSVIEPGIDRWTNNIDAYAARGQLLLKLPVAETETEWLLNAHGGENNSRAFQYQHRGVTFLTSLDPTILIPDQTAEAHDTDGFQDDTNDPFKGYYNVDGPEDISLFGSNLKGTWLFGDGYELQSLTAYEWHDRYILENTDASPKRSLESEYGDSSWQLSQQLDLRGHWGESDFGDGDFSLGAYYLQEDLDVFNFFTSKQSSNLDQRYTQKMWNFAVSGMSEYRFRPGCASINLPVFDLNPCDFTLITGLRYNVEYKEFDTVVCATGDSADCEKNTHAGQDDALWDGPGAEISLAWNYSEDSSLYFKYSRGWKGGHFNGSGTTTFDVISSVEPEIIDSLEGGLRSYWFDGRLMLNTTGFYYDYQDLQVFTIEQTPLGFPIPKLVNANDALVYGVELDLGAHPLPGLNLNYNFAWVESEYLDFVVSLPFIQTFPRDPPRPPQPSVHFRQDFDYSGNPLVASPRFSMTGSVDYTLPLPGSVFGQGFGSLTPRYSFSWKDEMFFDACSGRGALCNFPEGTFGQEPFWVHNASLTWSSDNERLVLSGWVRNFLDEHYKTQSFDITRGNGILLDAYADPRTYGITATLAF